MPFYTGNLKDAYRGVVKIKVIDFEKAEEARFPNWKLSGEKIW